MCLFLLGCVSMRILYKHDNYLNPNISYIFNKPIIEYDMKDAGFSIAKKYKLLTEKEIKKLTSVGKRERTYLLGNIQRDRKEVKIGIQEGFKYSRQKFFEMNEIDDNDIISIKRDAIFLIGYIKYERLDEYIHFRQKNAYTSYMCFKSPRLELYYNKYKIDIKGIDDDVSKKHHEYMIDFINKVFVKMESSDRESVLNFLRIFIDKYRLLKLDTEYYREFNSQSMFRYLNGELSDIEYLEDKSMLDISCNFELIKKLVKIAL